MRLFLQPHKNNIIIEEELIVTFALALHDLNYNGTTSLTSTKMQTILGWNLRKKEVFPLKWFLKSVMILDYFLGHLGNLVLSPGLKVSILSRS